MRSPSRCSYRCSLYRREPHASRSAHERSGSAIEVSGVSKTFWIPHEQRARLKEYFAQPLKRIGTSGTRCCATSPSRSRRGSSSACRAERERQEHATEGACRHLPRRAGTCGSRGRLSPFIELGVGFNPEFSARTNIEINGMLIGLTRRQVAERFDAILEFAGLERFVDQQ